MAEYFSVDPNHNLFVLGLFSVIEAYLNRDMADILSEVYLRDEYKEALIFRTGKLGDLLNLIESLEKLKLKDLNIYIEKYSLSLEIITEKYIKALEESENLMTKFIH